MENRRRWRCRDRQIHPTLYRLCEGEKNIQQDISLFTGLLVLRTQGAKYQDMTFLRTMSRLRVWKVVETIFVSLAGMDDFVRLKLLCCWLG